MHSALEAIRQATLGTPFEGDLWLVGGAVRDELLELPAKNDLDIVTRGSAASLARDLYEKGISEIPPVTYERFGTAMIRVWDVDIEMVTARKESYDENSRKPNVEAATYVEDALRRDFTVNTLMRNIHSGELWDPLNIGVSDLKSRILRTPTDARSTFFDDPLRMLRAVRFRWKLGFEPAPGLYETIRESRGRLSIISFERIRDEFVKMLGHPTAPDALQDLMQLGLFDSFMPEFVAMVGCEQGKYHHLDVWDHTMLVLRNVGSSDLTLALSALFHDVAKPPTRTLDAEGNTRFFGHETLGAEMTQTIMRRLKFAQREIDGVALLVKNHMRLGSAPTFSSSAARRVLRDLGDLTGRLLDLVEADTLALKPGVRVMELSTIRAKLQETQKTTPKETLESPLSGSEIMGIMGIQGGPEVGRIKRLLTDRVLDGLLMPSDKNAAIQFLEELKINEKS